MSICNSGLNGVGYSYHDLVKYIKTTATNMDKKDLRESQSFYILSILETLTCMKKDCCNLIKCVYKINRFHKDFIKDVTSMSKNFKVELSCDIESIDHEVIRETALTFNKLPKYKNNILEPMLLLLVQDTEHRTLVGSIISALCRGLHVDVKIGLYELEENIEKG